MSVSSDIKVIQGRMGYEFSTCFRGSDLLFRKIVKHWEPDKVCATKYTFELRVDMQQNDNGEFELVDVYYKFLNKVNDKRVGETLEPANSGGLTESEINTLDTVCESELPNCGDETKMSMRCLADLIKIYLCSESRTNYKTVIVSVIINYNPGESMSHQCSFVALGGKHKKLLFYEPYGLYQKYGKSYKKCFNQVFEVLLKLPFLKSWDYSTYHKYFVFPKGLQGMMLDQGKINKVRFLRDYHEIKDKMGATKESWEYENNDADFTMPASTLMTKTGDRPEFIRESAILYRNHSAKTCVSIFLVESARLIYYLNQDDDYEVLKNNLTDWYSTYSKYASSRVLNELYQIIDLIYPSSIRDLIYDTFLDVKNTPEKICEILTSA